MKIKIDLKKDALLVVDLQNDFITGSLAVPGAEKILPVVRKYLDLFDDGDLIFFSKDHHPKNHSSFKEFGGPWPPHCIQGDVGANLHVVAHGYPGYIVTKGADPDKEAYSAFDDTGLAGLLKTNEVERLFVCGLATDYCVKATVMDALKYFDGEISVLADATASVDVNPGDGIKAIMAMLRKGVHVVTYEDFETSEKDIE
jgi:nicotinamidase/pyrazinamidase